MIAITGIGNRENKVNCQLICVDIIINTAQPITSESTSVSTLLGGKHDAIDVIGRTSHEVTGAMDAGKTQDAAGLADGNNLHAVQQPVDKTHQTAIPARRNAGDNHNGNQHHGGDPHQDLPGSKVLFCHAIDNNTNHFWRNQLQHRDNDKQGDSPEIATPIPDGNTSLIEQIIARVVS
ncbi:Uncharacterised protein [Escherichia coli]|uniref:Uncharacterized protein n=1 Tax=Escherichia coli TaxID=562 RepID=A0A377F9B6_ECOLX|nr:Uncharacterised protein [Escherichia coli]